MEPISYSRPEKWNGWGALVPGEVEGPFPRALGLTERAELPDKLSAMGSQRLLLVLLQEPVGKPYSQDLSRSPQSLSDTGYSSDGVSSSQSEITGVVQQEVEQLDSAGVTGPRPPSPSQLHKVGSSVRPSLQAQGLAPGGERSKPPCGSSGEEQKRRPHSLSIMPEAFDSDEELEDILEEEDSLEWRRQREQQDTAESSDDL